jgi:hypothetical protein
MLRYFKNNLQCVRNMGGENFTERFTQSPKAGESFTIRKQALGTVRSGETYSASNYIERTVTVTCQPTIGMDFEFGNRELMFNMDQIDKKVVQPFVTQLAANVDSTILKMATQATFNAVGTPGTTPNTLITYNQARAKQSWQSAPMTDHTLLITPDMQVNAVDAGKSLFTPSDNLGKAFQTGTIVGKHYGADVYEIQNPYIHTVGPLGGSPVVNGAGQSGATLNTNGWTASAAVRLKKGDVFTIANVFTVNPFTLTATNQLAQFVVTADTSSDGTGAAALPISPAIVTSGPYQNVSAAPANSAAITVLGAANTVSPTGLRFQKDAFVFGSFSLPEPSGAVEFAKTVTDPETGLSLRYIRDWDTINNKQINRIDVVYAFGVAFPEWACRIQS